MNERMYTFLTRAYGEEKMSSLELEISENVSTCFDQLKDAKLNTLFGNYPFFKKHMHTVCRNNYLDELFKELSTYVADHQLTAEEAKQAFASVTPLVRPRIENEFNRQSEQLRVAEEFKDSLRS